MPPPILLPLGATPRKSDESYVRALEAAGLRVQVIRPGEPMPTAFAGLTLAGGTDIDPARYGQPPHPANYPPEPARDALEIALVEAAIAAGAPVFAICRGMQMLNVARGGALIQHLPDVVGHGGHADAPPVDEKHRPAHTVTIEQPGRLRDLLGAGPIAVNSRHHQAVDPARPGSGLRVIGRADDGTVEALDWDLPGQLFAVQWHPEDIALGPPGPMREQARALFEAFAAAAREFASA
jgi:gamma-glutamyl-gamma-aminobutyrate hydrolase PuuD